MSFLALDIFAGAGGLSEGLRQAGFRVIGAIESDSLACETYSLNHPNTMLWERPIERVKCSEVMEALGIKRGELALLAACPPCQGFSRLRTRNGAKSMTDKRNDLVFQVLRFIRVLRPRAVMLENVPGFAKDYRFRQFCRQLEEYGYELRWDILNAASYGVPQRRRRLILLASLTGKPDFAPEARFSRTVEDAIGYLRCNSHRLDPLHTYTVRRSSLVMERIREIPKDGGSRSALGEDLQLACHQRLSGYRDVYGRMSWSGVSPTITGGCINPSKGRFLHPEEDRAITLREAALLQSFPRSYRFSLSRGRYPAALLIGNALPPEFIRRHALALMRRMVEADMFPRRDGTM